MTRVCFLHTGSEGGPPALFVKSLRKQHADAEIIQCTDPLSPEIPGVSSVLRIKGDISKLMTFRLQCFARVEISAPTWFFDTDMLCRAPLDTPTALNGADVAVCQREFDRDTPLKSSFGNLDFSEFRKKTAGKVFPYIACSTLVNHPGFWKDCRKSLERAQEKFHIWFGDQIAIKDVVRSGRYHFEMLRESRYACLPEFEKPGAVMLHFKGAHRKHLMEKIAHD